MNDVVEPLLLRAGHHRFDAPRRRATSTARPLRRVALGVLTTLVALSSVFDLAAEEAPREPIDLALYGRLLEDYTRVVPDTAGTRVDYRGLSRSADWKRLSSQLRAAAPSHLDRNGRLAFWINAYNILTIDLILEHYPIDSIRDIGSFFSPVWDRTVARIEGRELSLGAIEHEILRKLGEPRIHAAIVCASTSCPPLARSPFRADTLATDLDAAMRAWLASPTKGIAIDRGRQRVTLSKVFDWFAEDFESRGGVLEAIAPYVPSEDAQWLRGAGRQASIRYFDYDWTLNDLK